MSLTLIIAVLFTVAAALSLLRRTGRYWWALPLVFAAAATINWLRYFEVWGLSG